MSISTNLNFCINKLPCEEIGFFFKTKKYLCGFGLLRHTVYIKEKKLLYKYSTIIASPNTFNYEPLLLTYYLSMLVKSGRREAWRNKKTLNNLFYIHRIFFVILPTLDIKKTDIVGYNFCKPCQLLPIRFYFCCYRFEVNFERVWLTGKKDQVETYQKGGV